MMILGECNGGGKTTTGMARLPSLLLLLRRSSSGRAGSSTTDDLLQWVCQQGGRVLPAVHLQRQNGRGDLGLVVTEAVQSGESLIALPPHLPLCLPIDQPPALAALAQRVPEKLWAMKLGLKLLAERVKKYSFWRPYIHNLPERLRMPVFFSEDEIQQLQYPPIIHQVKKRCEFLLRFAAEDIPKIIRDRGDEEHPFGGQQVDAAALGWAMGAVSSRAFSVNQSCESGCPSLLPLVDMCNHSFTPTARLVQYTSSAQSLPVLEVVAQQDLERGDALILDYGQLSNDILLLDYGFVIPNNPHDRVELQFELQLLETACFLADLHAPSSFTEPAPWQHALLMQLKLQGPDASQMVTLGGKELVDCRLLAAVRLLHAEDGSKVRSMGVNMLQSWDAPTASLGLANECKVLQTLVGVCMVATAPFPTSITDDRDILNRDDISENIRLATEFQTNKKQLLVNTARSLELRLKSLTGQELVSGPRL